MSHIGELHLFSPVSPPHRLRASMNKNNNKVSQWGRASLMRRARQWAQVIDMFLPVRCSVDEIAEPFFSKIENYRQGIV